MQEPVMVIFLTVLATIFIAEMGDKTQLLLVAMTGKYKVSHILTGTWLATIVLNILAVGVGAALSNYLDMRLIKLAAGLAFFYFAYATLKGEDDEEEEAADKGRFGPVVAIFCSFFLGELGDKTQLSGITLAATYTQGSFLNAFWVFLGCTVGLILADLLGLIVGVVLKSKMPTGGLNALSFVIFAVFGVTSIYTAMTLIFGAGAVCWMGTVIITAAFAVLCLVTLRKKQRN
jgi:putative Ca2+/H+ antiporter (TMEM165/GDT1 family)